VLDLDETLIHYDSPSKKLHFRPFCLNFLKQLEQFYEIVVFTAASKDYADYILDLIDPHKQYISHRLYRDHTTQRDGVYLKDLSLLGRNVNRCIIIDNLKENFELQKDNGIHIKGFYDDPSDRELERMVPFLKGVVEAEVRDVRPLIKLHRADGLSGGRPSSIQLLR